MPQRDIKIKIKGLRLGRPASAWVWLLGMLCLCVAALLFPVGTMSYLTPTLGSGPAIGANAPALIGILGVTAFLIHCLSVLLIGTSGWLILHRAWNPGKTWSAHRTDPSWSQAVVERYNYWSRRPLMIAWRGTYLAMILGALGWAYMDFGELLHLAFAVQPDAAVSHYVYRVVLVVWPATFLALSNIYSVKVHFLSEEAQVDDMVQPQDVADLVHRRDAQPSGFAELFRRTHSYSGLLNRHGIQLGVFVLLTPVFSVAVKNWFPQSSGLPGPLTWFQASLLGAVVAFTCAFVLHFRTVILRQRTAEIGKTDVQVDWAAQQALRAYRGGSNHRLSESNCISFAAHIVLIVGPVLLSLVTGMFGCVKQHKIPYVDGDDSSPPKTQAVKFIKKKRTFIVNEYVSILIATFDASQVDVEIEEATRHEYTGRVPRGIGNRDGNSTRDGMPGVPGGVVRFVRIQHDGADWERNVALKSDLRMLQEFQSRTNGIPVAARSESIRITDIPKYNKDTSPPFIYMTGRKPFSISPEEARILRDYLLNRGGFLIGDSPGDYFSSSFKGAVSRALGAKARWVDIPNDDILYNCNARLPNGAPPLWHHDGARAKGIKHNGRWIVFFHPGDMGDAWKNGHSGADSESVDMAYNMGVNLIHYSIRQYVQFHKGKF